MEIAVTGIDGSGKTTFVRETVNLLRSRGIKAGHIDLPYFTEVAGFKKIGETIAKLWRWAETRNLRFINLSITIVSTMLYLIARRRMRHCSILLVEHQPLVDAYPYATLYAGLVGRYIARASTIVWPHPDAIVWLKIPPQMAIDRILIRNKRIQPHETIEQLTFLEQLIGQWTKRTAIKVQVLDNPMPIHFVDHHLPLLGQVKAKTLKQRLADGELLTLGQSIVIESIDRWKIGGLINTAQAHRMENTAAGIDPNSWLAHFGAHFLISLLFRFPLGSISRSLWVVGWRLEAWRKRHKDEAAYRKSKSIHTIPTMALAAIPGVGVIAYLCNLDCLKSGLFLLLLDTGFFRIPSRFLIWKRKGRL